MRRYEVIGCSESLTANKNYEKGIFVIKESELIKQVSPEMKKIELGDGVEVKSEVLRNACLSCLEYNVQVPKLQRTDPRALNIEDGTCLYHRRNFNAMTTPLYQIQFKYTCI